MDDRSDALNPVLQYSRTPTLRVATALHGYMGASILLWRYIKKTTPRHHSRKPNQ